jgi:hypothetical protein
MTGVLEVSFEALGRWWGPLTVVTPELLLGDVDLRSTPTIERWATTEKFIELNLLCFMFGELRGADKRHDAGYTFEKLLIEGLGNVPLGVGSVYTFTLVGDVDARLLLLALQNEGVEFGVGDVGEVAAGGEALINGEVSAKPS